MRSMLRSSVAPSSLSAVMKGISLARPPAQVIREGRTQWEALAGGGRGAASGAGVVPARRPTPPRLFSGVVEDRLGALDHVAELDEAGRPQDQARAADALGGDGRAVAARRVEAEEGEPAARPVLRLETVELGRRVFELDDVVDAFNQRVELVVVHVGHPRLLRPPGLADPDEDADAVLGAVGLRVEHLPAGEGRRAAQPVDRADGG